MAVEILRFFENSAIISTVNNFNHYNKIRRVNFRGQIFQMLFFNKHIQAYSSTYLGSMSTKDPYLPKFLYVLMSESLRRTARVKSENTRIYLESHNTEMIQELGVGLPNADRFFPCRQLRKLPKILISFLDSPLYY